MINIPHISNVTSNILMEEPLEFTNEFSIEDIETVALSDENQAMSAEGNYHSSKKETTINPKKSAILLGYTNTIYEAKDLAKQYNENDIFINMSMKYGSASYSVYIVNIAKSNTDFLLSVVSNKNTSAKIISNVRLKYFTRTLSSNNIFIAANYINNADTISKTQTSLTAYNNNEVNNNMTIIDAIPKQKNDNIDAYNTVSINTNKYAIFLEYATTIAQAKALAKKHDNHDIYIYNTIKNNISCNAVYIINIDNNNINSTLREALSSSSTAKVVSKVKLKYFAKNISTDNIILKSTNIFHSIPDVQTATIKYEVPVVNEEIVSTEKKKVLETVKKESEIAKDIDTVNKSEFIGFSKEVKTIPISTFTSIKNSALRIYASVSSSIKDNILISYNKIHDAFSRDVNIKVATLKVIKKQPIIKQIDIVIEKEVVLVSTINTNKKAITIANVSSMSRAKNIANKLSKYDIYIYKTTSTKTPSYITYAVNIDKNKLSSSVLDIKKSYKDAYLSSDSRIKTLATNNFTKNIFISNNTVNNINKVVASSDIKVQPFIDTPVVKEKISDEYIKFSEENILFLLDNKKVSINTIVKKPKSLSFNTIHAIDTNKRVVTITNVGTLKRAQNVAKKLSNYDIYIYKTLENSFVIYAVNIDKNSLSNSISDINNYFKSAYVASNKRVKTLKSNNFKKNIFVKASKSSQKLSSI